MTVVVALAGKDAIVLAADSQETTGTVKTTTQKLRIVGGAMAWAGTGDSALIQRVEAEHDPIGDTIGGPRWPTASAISAVTTPIQIEGVSAHLAVNNASTPIFGGLFCWYDDKANPCIWQISANVASSQFKSDKAALGSGQAAAEVALASVAHLGVRELDTARLEMVAWKSIYDVITSSAYYVGHPISLAVIEHGSARILPNDELRAIEDSVQIWLARQREVLDSLAEVALIPTASAPPTTGEISSTDGVEEVGIEPPRTEQ